MLLLLVPLFGLSQEKAQVEVVNATGALLVVNTVSIPHRQALPVSVSTNGDVAQLEVSYYEGLEAKKAQIYRKIDRGRVIVRDLKDSKGLAEDFRRRKVSASASGPTASPTASLGGAGSWATTVSLGAKNISDEYSIFIPLGPFRGLALAPGTRSSRKGTLPTGPVSFPIKMITDPQKSATGISTSWGIFNGIITETDSVVAISDKSISQANSGRVIKKKIISSLDTPVQIAEGASLGTVIEKGRAQVIKLYLGWNIIPVQFLSGGNPSQGDLIIMVSESPRPLVIQEGQVEGPSLNKVSIIRY